MRDWTLVLAPLAVVTYFVVRPDQLSALATFAERFVR